MKFQALETTAAYASSPWKFLAALFLVPFVAGAESGAAGFVLAKTNVVAEQFYRFDQNIEIAGTISDDAVIAAAGVAKLSGTVSNDLWVGAAQGVEITGHVGDHARLASVKVTAAGMFDRDVIIFGQTVNLATNNHVGGSVEIYGSRVVLEGNVGSNATIMASSATISGHIRGTLNVTADEIELLRGARIDGDLLYTSPKELLFDPKLVTVGGKLVHRQPPVVSPGTLVAVQLTISTALMVSALMTGCLFIVLFPRFTGGAIRILRHSTLRCATAGLFFAGVAGLFAVFAIPTVIAAPFGATLVASLGVLMYVGTIVVALTIGGIVLRQQGQQPVGRALLALTIGLGMLYVAKSLPFVGLYITFFSWFAGAGALILNMMHAQRAVAHPPPLPDATDADPKS